MAHQLLRWRTLSILAVILFVGLAYAKLECDPSSNTKKADPENPESYLYCNLEGSFSKRKCVSGKIFNSKSKECEDLFKMNDEPYSDPFAQPFFQAPDDLCGAGIPLTILSAPVVCNPSMASCPDGYVCRMYERTGTSYCCQNQGVTDESESCSSDQVTYIEPSTGRARSCVLGASDSCPVGFGCNLVGGTTTRCCGKDFGCPFNAAGFINPLTGSHVECNSKAANSCQRGFQCARSTKFNKYICCSNADGDTRNTQCPNGDSPLASPSRCSASAPCPSGYVCSDEKCCPAIGVCPAGLPLGGGVTVCNENHPCTEGYECVTTGGAQYCCPKKEKVCTQSKHAGTACANSRSAVTRYYFDQSTGTCRSFQYSQCGGNSNNFNSLEECEGFCVDAQCTYGQAYRVGAVNAACSMSSLNTCPRQHVCTTPSFGPSPICCPTQEMTCNEMVSAGTPCFGRSMTIQRYYFNPATRKCTPYQYYGCNGNGNNFHSMEMCQDFCLNAVDTACGGVAPLLDPNNRAQTCDRSVSCPDGYSCNPEGYCCPETRTACAASLSRGNVCAGTAQRTMWYYDTAQQKCRQFLYNGCGGSPNRFISQTICSQTCVQASTVGQCPRGMTAFVEKGDIAPKSCTLNVRGTCPSGTSCVRSSANVPICCQTVHACPGGRTPYNIPGSTSVVACNVESDTCPSGNSCQESSTIAGFHLCCSSSSQARPQKGSSRNTPQPKIIQPIAPSRGSSKNNRNGVTNRKGSTLASLIGASPCPGDTQGNGMLCSFNKIGECPTDHVCYKKTGYADGSCCKAPELRCSQKGYMPIFLTNTQMQLCQLGERGCPTDAKCQTTNVPDISMCCRLYSASGAKNTATNNQNPYGNQHQQNRGLNNMGMGQQTFGNNNQFNNFNGNQNNKFNGVNGNSFGQQVGEVGADSIHVSVAGNCKNMAKPFRDDNGMVHQCSFIQNSCPGGFKCEFSTAGVPVCCAHLESIKCPAHSTPFEYGGRPLACPPGSTKCPSGYSCVPSMNPLHHLCCSDGGPRVPTCARGVAYVDPTTNNRQYCSPMMDNCPNGFHCLESQMPGQFICCTEGDLSERFAGYCPPRQIPHVELTGQPASCHMTLKPCPTSAAYVCIYSAEKQDSYCCAPIDSAVRQYHPSLPMPGNQMNKISSFPGQSVPSNFANGGFNQNQFGNGGLNQNNKFGVNGGVNGFSNNQFPAITMPPAHKVVPVPQFGISDLEKKEMEKGRLLAAQAIQRAKLAEQQRLAQIEAAKAKNAEKFQTIGAGVVSSTSASQWEVVGSEQSELEKAHKLGEQIASQIKFSSYNTAGCPAGSRALVGSDRNAVECDSTPCPEGFACVYADQVNRWQCCSTSSVVLATGEKQPNETAPLKNLECPFGFNMVEGKCLKIMYVGQKGCISNDQCSSREANATCDSGYCICPAGKPLVHESKCIANCPEGFSNIAGRCYDPTTVIFMDSVDERNNGTIGGYCLETLVEEKRCLVRNAYCSEKTVTCMCKPGYDLDMDFGNKKDNGHCKKLAATKFDEEKEKDKEPELDEELYFIDIGTGPSSNATGDAQSDAPADDIGRYLLPQTEEAIPVFA